MSPFADFHLVSIIRALAIAEAKWKVKGPNEVVAVDSRATRRRRFAYIAGRSFKLRARCKARYTNPVRSLPIHAATGKRVKKVNRNSYYYFGP